MSAALEALLDAHVAFELARLRGEALRALLVEHSETTLRWFTEVTVDDVITPEQIMGVIDRYVIAFKVSGGITELVGEMARLVFSSRTLDNVTVAEILPFTAYEGFADKVVALERVRREIVSLIAHSTTFGAVTSEVLARTITDLFFQRAESQPKSALFDLEALQARVLPEFEKQLGAWIARYIEQHRAAISRGVENHILAVLDSERLRGVADEIWDALSPLPLLQAFAFIGEQDLEDFVILGHEFWLKFREAPYFRNVLNDAVGYFFRKYGKESLRALIEDMGVSEAMVKHELLTLLAPLVEHAHDTGFMAQQIRAHLAGFYRSPEAARALADSLC